MENKELLKELKAIKKSFHIYKNMNKLNYLFLRKSMKLQLDERMELLKLQIIDTRYKNIQFLNDWIDELTSEIFDKNNNIII